MQAYTYIEKGKFALLEKAKPTLIEPTDAVVKVTLGSICTSDLHIKHGSVPCAVPGITVGHEMVGIVEQVGSEVTAVKPGDRIRIIKVDVDKYGVTANQPMKQREKNSNLFGLYRVATEEDDSQYGIQSVPTLMLFRQGDVLWRTSGIVQKSELLATIKSLSKK